MCGTVRAKQGVTKRRRLSWLTNSAFLYDPNKCSCTQEPNKLWRSNTIFNLWCKGTVRSYCICLRVAALDSGVKSLTFEPLSTRIPLISQFLARRLVKNFPLSGWRIYRIRYWVRYPFNEQIRRRARQAFIYALLGDTYLGYLVRNSP